MANLSNINGKFLFTDGDFLLIGGATANSISATESGVAIKNSNAATLSLQNSATNGKNHTLWSNTDGSFNITDVGVATRFTIASGGDVYIPSGNVSIGNTSVYPSGSNTILQIYSVSIPRLKLQNSTTGTASTDGSQFYVNGSDLNITNSESANIIFSTNAIERMRIDSSGNVSILKTDSSTYSSTTPVADLILSRKNTGNTNNETVGIRFDVTGWSGSTTGGAAIEAIQPSNVSSADLAFLTRNAGTWGERMRIDSSGNVAIGISFATAKLQIHNTNAGAAAVAAYLVNASTSLNTETRLAFAAHTNDDIATNRYSYISTINTSGSNGQDMIFATNATGAGGSERMRIDSSGNSTFTGNVNINGTTGTPSISVKNPITGGNNEIFQRWQYVPNNTNFRLDLTQRETLGLVRYAFDLVNNGTAYNSNLVLDRGNVGIGTDSPGGNLEIKTLAGGSGVNTLRLNTNFSGGNTVDINPFISGFNNGGMEIKLAGSQKLVMLPSGDVGIGTTSPAAKLDVAGDITIQNGLYTYKTQGYTAGSSAINVDITVGNEGGAGNVFKIEAGFAHYYGMSYNSIGEWWCTSRGTNVSNTYILNAGTTFGGTWSSSKPNTTTLRVTKSAGTYAGGGKWWIKVTYVPF